MPLLYLCISWLAGIIIGSLISLPAWLLALALLIIIPAILLRNHRKTLVIAALCWLCLIGGSLRYASSIPPTDNSSLLFFNGNNKVQIEGMVSGDPETKGSSTEFTLSANSVIVDNQEHTVKGDVLVHLPFYKEYHYGDVLLLSGKLEEPARFADFDYKEYLSNQGIYSIMNYPQVTLLEADRGFKPLSWIYYARGRLAETLTSSLPEPQGSLSQAILFGLRGNLPQSLVQSFYNTGTTHLIALSGMNLTIILGLVFALAIRLFGRKNLLYIWLSLAAIWLYSILTGLPPTMVRASIMGSIFLLAEALGRQRNAVSALSLAAALMTITEPRLLWDVSFQLSFLSMLGLVLISPLLIRTSITPGKPAGSRYVRTIKNGLVISFGATLAAVIMTFPITAFDFHSFSLVSAPATFFAMPAFPGIIFTSLVTSIAGLIWQPLGYLIGWISWLFLSYFLMIINIFNAIPFAYVQNITIQPWQIALYYLALICCLLMAKNWQSFLDWFKIPGTWISALMARFKRGLSSAFIYGTTVPLLIISILVWTAFISLPDGKLHVSILDVGQGESILIRTPDGKNILVDAGPAPTSACIALGKKLPFWDRKIDTLILTQLQSDHISGTFEVLRRYDVNTIALPSVESASALSTEITREFERLQVNIHQLKEGQEFNLGRNIRLSILNPSQSLFQGTDDDANNNSVILRLVYDKVSFLLTSDIGKEAEYHLIENRADLQSSVLKVAHHGSKNSSSNEFIRVVDPSAAVISCGLVNRFGHPDKEIVNRIADYIASENVFITSKNGTIEYSTDGQKLWCQVENIAK